MDNPKIQMCVCQGLRGRLEEGKGGDESGFERDEGATLERVFNCFACL